MFQRIDRAVPALTAAMVLGVLTLAALSPVGAYAAGSGTSTSAQVDKAAQKPVDQAEARIKELHAKLHITAGQESQWDAFVKAQRDSADEMSGLILDREKGANTMTAKDDFRSYAKIAQAHSDGLKKIVPAFDALYDSMSDEQKKTADALFRHAPAKAAS